jgi:glutamyl-tRNA synthetase
MHIGNLRVALLNHILSKQLNVELLIRIEDTDKEKNIEGKDKEILEILNLFSIDYTRIVHQSENVKYHTQMAMKLLLDKKAFNCFCSEEALEKDKEIAKKDNKHYSYSGFCETISDEAKFNCNAPFVVRLKKPTHTIKFTDLVKGDFSYEPFEVDSFEILRHDKSPTSNFASGVDDMLYDISTIIRDEDNILNTPKQIHVRESLGYVKEINYIHLQPIVDLETSKKLSKEDKYYTVKFLIDEGYLPIAIANYLILLEIDTPKEIFTLEEAIEWFDISKISQKPVKFDINKLNFINCEHLKLLDDMRFSKIIGFADEDIGQLAKIYIEECKTTQKIKEKIQTIFSEKNTLENHEEDFSSLKKCLQNAPYIEEFTDLQKYITDKTGLQDEKLFTLLSFILTGTTYEPNLNKIYPLIRNYLGEITK